MWKEYEEESQSKNGNSESTPEDYLSKKINAAINFNNWSVVELRSKNYPGALEAAKQALEQIEKLLLDQT